MAKQVSEIHWATRALDPGSQKASSNYSPELVQKVLAFLRSYVPEEDRTELSIQFIQFRTATGPFHPYHPDGILAEVRNDPCNYWRLAELYAPELSRIALRLWLRPANSVPSERAFSATNFVQNRHRTRLFTAMTSNLTYIYINTRALRNKDRIDNDYRERKALRQQHLNNRWAEKRQQRLEEIRFAVTHSEFETTSLEDLEELADQVAIMEGLAIAVDEVFDDNAQESESITQDLACDFPRDPAYDLTQDLAHIFIQGAITPSTSQSSTQEFSQLSTPRSSQISSMRPPLTPMTPLNRDNQAPLAIHHIKNSESQSCNSPVITRIHAPVLGLDSQSSTQE